MPDHIGSLIMGLLLLVRLFGKRVYEALDRRRAIRATLSAAPTRLNGMEIGRTVGLSLRNQSGASLDGPAAWSLAHLSLPERWRPRDRTQENSLLSSGNLGDKIKLPGSAVHLFLDPLDDLVAGEGDAMDYLVVRVQWTGGEKQSPYLLDDNGETLQPVTLFNTPRAWARFHLSG